jgi:hypothetical protein
MNKVINFVLNIVLMPALTEQEDENMMFYFRFLITPHVKIGVFTLVCNKM